MHAKHIQFYDHLTWCGKLGLMMITSERVLLVLKQRPDEQVYKWFSESLKKAWNWVEKRNISVQEYYNRFIDKKVGHFLAEDNKQVIGAFNTCLNTLLYTLEVMYTFAPPDLRVTFPIPSIIADTDDLITLECLEWALKASKDKKEELAWQEKVINQLLIDFYTDDKKIIGEPIKRDYFEQFM